MRSARSSSTGSPSTPRSYRAGRRASLLAGCGDAPPDGTPEPMSTVSPTLTATLESRFVNDGVVEYLRMVDGAATVEDADGGSRVEHDADAETLTVTLFT